LFDVVLGLKAETVDKFQLLGIVLTVFADDEVEPKFDSFWQRELAIQTIGDHFSGLFAI